MKWSDRRRLPRPEWSAKLRDRLGELDYKAGRWLMSPVVKWTVYICIAVFLLKALLPLRLNASAVGLWDGIFGASVQGTILRARIWQLVTYAFVHADLWHGGVMHLLFNLLGLWMFGTRLEMAWGATRFTRLMLVTAVGSALVHLVVTALLVGFGLIDPMMLRAPIIGLSGVVYGILLVYAVLHPKDIFYLYGLVRVQMRTIAWVLGALALFGSLGYGEGGVAHLGHLGGLLFGWLFLKYPRMFEWIPLPRVGHRRWKPPVPRSRG